MLKRYAVTVLVVAGCSAWSTPQIYPLPDPAVLDHPYDIVWAASIEVAAESRLAFRILDRASGYFLTQPMLTPFADSQRWWDCGTDEFPNLDVVAEVSMVVVRIGEFRTRVRVYTSNIQTTQGRQCSSRGVLEATLLDGIVERADELGAS